VGDWLGSLVGGGATAGGTAGAELGGTLAGMLGPEAAGAAFEGGAGAAGAGAGETAGMAAGGAGLGLGLGAALAPFMIGAMFGNMLEGRSESLFGYRPEGWSHAHALARTAQQNAAMGLSNDIMTLAKHAEAGDQLPDAQVIPLLQQLAIPQSAMNLALFRALDEGMTEKRGKWPEQAFGTSSALKTLLAHYGDKIDPLTQVGLVASINARQPEGAEPMKMPTLTAEQFRALNPETQMAYQEAMDPGWREKSGEQRKTFAIEGAPTMLPPGTYVDDIGILRQLPS
jgi:hypothetical protein